MARDKIAEIADLRSRGLQHLSRGKDEFEKLCEWWKAEDKEIGNSSDQLIIKIVTILEVNTRSFVRELIDKGQGYARKISVLVRQSEFKLDFAVAQALQNKQVTLGQLVSHNLSLSKIEHIYAAFSCLIEEDIVSKSNSIFEQRREALPYLALTKVSDVKSLQRALSRLFEVRNIIVHELPNDRPYVSSEIPEFVRYAGEFIDVTLQVALALIYPRYLNINLLEEAMEADAKVCEENEAELDRVIKSIDKYGNNMTFQDAHKSQKDYRVKQTTHTSKQHDINIKMLEQVYYNKEFMRLTLLKIQELRNFIKFTFIG